MRRSFVSWRLLWHRTQAVHCHCPLDAERKWRETSAMQKNGAARIHPDELCVQLRGFFALDGFELTVVGWVAVDNRPPTTVNAAARPQENYQPGTMLKPNTQFFCGRWNGCA